MDKLFQQIKELNLAHQRLCVAIKIMEKYVPLNKDLDLYLYRIKKNLDEFQKCLLKELKEQEMSQEFQRIVKNWEREIK